MSRPDTFPAALLRGIALAAWSWIVFAAFGALVFATGPTPPSMDVPSTVGEAFIAILTFDLGASSVYGRPALSVAIERVGPTLSLLAGTTVVAAVLGFAVLVLARQGGSGRRIAEALGYVLAFPAAAWILMIAAALGDALVIGGDRFGVIGLAAGSLALALPLVALVARIVVREPNGRGWVLDAWLFASWLLGTVAVVESLVGPAGVGELLTRVLFARDAPLLIAAAALLTLPALLGAVVREIAWSGGPHAAIPGLGAAGRADRDTVPADPRRVVRENTRVRVGLLGIAALLALGAVGAALPVPPARPLAPSRILSGVAGETLDVLLVGVLAALLGVGLGLVSARVPYGRVLSAALAGYAASIPLLLWLLVLRPSGVPGHVFAVLAVASLVGLRAARDIDPARSLAVGDFLPALGVASVGAGVVELVTLQLSTLGVTSRGWIVVGGLPTTASALLLAVGGLPALSLFLLGEGLRRA